MKEPAGSKHAVDATSFVTPRPSLSKDLAPSQVQDQSPFPRLPELPPLRNLLPPPPPFLNRPKPQGQESPACRKEAEERKVPGAPRLLTPDAPSSSWGPFLSFLPKPPPESSMARLLAFKPGAPPESLLQILKDLESMAFSPREHLPGGRGCKATPLPDKLPACAHACVQYPPEELAAATNGFSESLRLGHGGFGDVYKGMLRGTPVAVKRMLTHDVTLSGLKAELEVLSRIRHPHIVTLMGYSLPAHPSDHAYPCIVYEFMSGGDLFDSLDPRSGRPPLPALDRFRVAAEVASALAYFNSHKPCIVHQDLKPRNILLDRHGTAKVADWGLACDVSHTMSDMPVRGTAGYVTPELAHSQRQLSTSADVYAFGIILLQLMTGILHPADVHGLASVQGGGNGGGIGGLSPRELLRHLDSVVPAWPEEASEQLLGMAIRCASSDRAARPSAIEDVLPTLRDSLEEALVFFSTPASSAAPHSSSSNSSSSSGSGSSFQAEGGGETCDKLEQAVSLLQDLDLTPEDEAAAGEVLLQHNKARLFCALSQKAREKWLKQQLKVPPSSLLLPTEREAPSGPGSA